MSNCERSKSKPRICPYWRKIRIINGEALVLCGRASREEKPEDLADLGPRLKKCPWFGAAQAYFAPAILIYNFFAPRSVPEVVVSVHQLGIEGINYLETLWDQEVENFAKRQLERYE